MEITFSSAFNMPLRQQTEWKQCDPIDLIGITARQHAQLFSSVHITCSCLVSCVPHAGRYMQLWHGCVHAARYVRQFVNSQNEACCRKLQYLTTAAREVEKSVRAFKGRLQRCALHAAPHTHARMLTLLSMIITHEARA